MAGVAQIVAIVVALVIGLFAGWLFTRDRERIADSLKPLEDRITDRLTDTRSDMAERLERTKGELNQWSADRMSGGFAELRESLMREARAARVEQGDTLNQATVRLEQRLEAMQKVTAERLDAIRGQVDAKLGAITEEVRHKLDENIKEGFAQFVKVQEHLKAAEAQLRSVGALGESINDLNNLLKLPHLRGRFGEQSLERLLEDFLPASMYALQAPPAEGLPGRVDAIIRFPNRNLPIDAKFPREQVMALFEGGNPADLSAAREQFAVVMKEQARKIAAYIHPEAGTTDMALMYLPSETLYMEAVLNGELSESLNRLKIFPVSPNTLIVTLRSIEMVFKMYEFAKGYERATEELRKAQASFRYFEDRFEEVGKSLGRAQEAYQVAANHLGRYRVRVTGLGGEQVPELEDDRGRNVETDAPEPAPDLFKGR